MGVLFVRGWEAEVWTCGEVRMLEGIDWKGILCEGWILPEYSESNGVKRSTNFVDRFFFAKGITYSWKPTFWDMKMLLLSESINLYPL